MDEVSLMKHMLYEFFFELTYEQDWRDYVIREAEGYSENTIDKDKFKFHVEVDKEKAKNGTVGFLDVKPLNEYTKIMLSLNKKSIIRYHKLEQINNRKYV